MEQNAKRLQFWGKKARASNAPCGGWAFCLFWGLVLRMFLGQSWDTFPVPAVPLLSCWPVLHPALLVKLEGLATSDGGNQPPAPREKALPSGDAQHQRGLAWSRWPQQSNGLPLTLALLRGSSSRKDLGMDLYRGEGTAQGWS